MRIRYSPRALDDLAEIIRYLDRRSPQAAQSVQSAITSTISILADFPVLAPLTELPEVREIAIVRYPYKVYYAIEGDEVRVIHIRDARRKSWIDEPPD